MLSYSDKIIICATFVAALLGVAFPILFQVEAELDEKYSSQRVIALFEKEIERKCFRISLVFAPSSILISFLNLPRIIDTHVPCLNYILDNSAIVLVILSTAILIFCFFLFVRKVLIYYTPNRFIQYQIRKHNSFDNEAAN